MSLSIVSSPRFGDHLTPPGHPESPERAGILNGVAERARDRGVRIVEPPSASDQDLLRVHTPAHLQKIEGARGRAVMLDSDTFTSPETAALARLAAGAAVFAVARCLDPERFPPIGDSPQAWEAGEGPERTVVLVRPPGHHAESGRAMGFCFYNNVAVAAAYARARGADRVAIVDFDVHHGNGTQEIFFADAGVLFVSMHQYPFYPGTGAATEIGVGPGEGFTVNLPMESGATDGDYQLAFDAVVQPIVRAYAPQLLLVSAGFDAHEDDPLGQMRLTTSGYGWFASRLAELAGSAGCGLVLVTEGGYALPALAASLDEMCRRLEAKAPEPPQEVWRRPTGRSDRAIASLRAAQGARWAGL
jgi:acetoin utilization deacetylase AcuC-like enzyme